MTRGTGTECSVAPRLVEPWWPLLPQRGTGGRQLVRRNAQRCCRHLVLLSTSLGMVGSFCWLDPTRLVDVRLGT